MYNEELEKLINAALADGELTEKEKVILRNRAQSMGVDLDEFEMVLDTRLNEIRKKNGMAMSSNQGASSGGMNAQKLFDALQEVEQKGVQMRAQQEEKKQKKLAEIAERYSNESKLVKLVGGKKLSERKMNEEAVAIREFDFASKEIDEKIEQEKENVIKNFPLSNNKEDLMDLLTMAASKAEDDYIWRSKTDQIYQKILIFSNNDPQLVENASNVIISLMRKLPADKRNFTRIPANLKGKLVEEVNMEIKAEKDADKKAKMKLWKKYGIWGGACLLLAIILMISGTGFLFGILFLIPAIVAWRKGKKAWKKYLNDKI